MLPVLHAHRVVRAVTYEAVLPTREKPSMYYDAARTASDTGQSDLQQTFYVADRGYLYITRTAHGSSAQACIMTDALPERCSGMRFERISKAEYEAPARGAETHDN